MTTSLRLPRVMAALIAALIAGACGGEGIAAPVSPGPNDEHACPAADDVLVSAEAQLDAGTFDPLRPHIEAILVEGEGLRTILNLTTLVLPGLDPAVATTLLDAASDPEAEETLALLKPHLIRVLEYLHGSSEALPGPHPEPLAAAHAVVVNCDPVDNVRLVRELLAVEVRRGAPGSGVSWELAPAGEGEVSFLGALVDAVDRAQQVPAFSSLLERIAIERDGDAPGDGGDIVVGREAFIVLAKLFAANAAAPDFELQPLRELLEQVFVPLLEGDVAAEAILDELLDLLAVIVDERAETFAAIQTFTGCVNRHDSGAAIPAMLYDYLSVDAFSVEGLLVDLADATRSARAGTFRLAAVTALDALLAHPAALDDASGVVGAFLADDVVPTVLDVLIALRGTGLLTDLLDFVETLLTCRDLAP
jgi:hypothetical protein